jgi:PAS domain S-box-containing protein
LSECNRVLSCDLSVQRERILAEAIYVGQLKRIREKLEAEMDLLFSSNETALIERKNLAAQMARKALLELGILFPAAAAGAYFLAALYSKRFFAPLYEITQSIRQVRQGNLDRKTAIKTQDEFGMLADEFNNMTRELLEFERQAIGSIQNERNKSVSIVQSINEPLLILDREGCILEINRAFEQLFELDEADALGRPIAEAVPHPDLVEYVGGFRTEGAAPEGKTILISGTDKEQYFHVVGTGLTDQDGRSNGLILVLHDVTEMKLLEKARGEFIATISHEFKTPLTSIVMGTDLLSDTKLGPLSGDQRQVLETIREDSQRLETLVGEMLELSRIESSKTIYHFAPCYISRIVAVSVRQFAMPAERNGVKLTVGNLTGLPPVRADMSKITWVVNNLISNALKYTREGDEIRIEAKQEGDYLSVSVADTGLGIPQEIADHLFEKFIHTVTYDIEMRGSGIGLAVSKEIIQAHGGRITFESAMPIGSKFIFTLPLA